MNINVDSWKKKFVKTSNGDGEKRWDTRRWLVNMTVYSMIIIKEHE